MRVLDFTNDKIIQDLENPIYLDYIRKSELSREAFDFQHLRNRFQSIRNVRISIYQKIHDEIG